MCPEHVDFARKELLEISAQLDLGLIVAGKFREGREAEDDGLPF